VRSSAVNEIPSKGGSENPAQNVRSHRDPTVQIPKGDSGTEEVVYAGSRFPKKCLFNSVGADRGCQISTIVCRGDTRNSLRPEIAAAKLGIIISIMSAVKSKEPYCASIGDLATD
jgi:hypothetical protein